MTLAAINLLWALWVLSWFAAAAWSSKPATRLPRKSQRRYSIFLIGGVILLFTPPGTFHTPVLWRLPVWPLTILEFAGFAFCWYARVHLGRLWSGTITAKADHRVVESGPYALVRHPIYTGLIAAFIATALAKATIPALLGAALCAESFRMKAKLEESWLTTQLGSAYADYRTRVAMLVPFGPK
jgi:protein-S-isoprenylcysteine O-methyltransferase Ste14